MMMYPLKIFDIKRDTKRDIVAYKRIIAKFKELISE
jgi:hypothetical protein